MKRAIGGTNKVTIKRLEELDMKIEIDEYKKLDGEWAKVGQDIKDGDRLQIKSAGTVQPSGFKNEDGSPKDQYVFKVMTMKRQEFNVAFNRTSRNTLGKGLGTDTEDWVGKAIKAFVVKQMVGDGLKNVLYLAPDGWEMNDDGEFYDPNGEAPTASKIPPKYDIEEADAIADSSPF